MIDVRNWKDTIYNYVDNKTREFAEKVRSVINEEFYKLQDSTWKMIKALPDSGKYCSMYLAYRITVYTIRDLKRACCPVKLSQVIILLYPYCHHRCRLIVIV